MQNISAGRIVRGLRRRLPPPQAPAAWGWPMIASYFVVIPNCELAFVMVSKNAVTFLKRVAVFNGTSEWLTGFQATHDAIGYTASSPYLVPTEQMDAWEAEHGKRRRFAVWRDPVGRIESLYSLFVLKGEHHPYLEYLGLQAEPSWPRFEQFLDWEWSKPHPEATDEHVRRQVDYYGPGDVDDIVPIGSLHAYLDTHGVRYRSERSNESGTGFKLTDHGALARVRAHYAADYDLLKAGKTWS